MARLMTTIAILAALLISGCAQKFSQAGVSDRQQAADEFECHNASQDHAGYGVMITDRTQMRRCMAAKGYK
jgi:outer membrane lipoprotein-sorting protein